MHFAWSCAQRLRPSSGSTPDDEPPLPSSLAGLAKLGGAREEMLVDLQAHGTLYALLGQSQLTVWSVRPTVLLAKVKRSSVSVRLQGANAQVVWQPGGLAVRTTRDRILLYALQAQADDTLVYRMPLGRPERTPFAPTPSEDEMRRLTLRADGELDATSEGIACICATEDRLLVATLKPAALYSLPWSSIAGQGAQTLSGLVSRHPAKAVSSLFWLIEREVTMTAISWSDALQLFVMIASDGRAYIVRQEEGTWTGSCMYGTLQPVSPLQSFGDTELVVPSSPLLGTSSLPGSPRKEKTALHPAGSPSLAFARGPLPGQSRAKLAAINPRFSLVALGLQDVATGSLRSTFSHHNKLRAALNSTATHLDTGAVNAASWTTDGHALALGWQHGWAVWTVYGRLGSWGVNGAGNGSDGQLSTAFEDHFMRGVSALFWDPADLALFVLTPPPESVKDKIMDEQLYVIPFAKSAVAGVHSPDNTSHACLQLDDRLLVYRGADQPDLSVINPESDVWQHIKIPSDFLYANWPIRYAAISADTRLMAVAGRRGLTHYNALSGRWKLFEDEAHEQAFQVRGGMQWFGNMLIVGCESSSGAHSIRVYARDKPLSHSYIVHEEPFASPVVLLSIFGDSLLVYSADNTIHHMLIAPVGLRTIALRMCGGIGFEGVVRDPLRVRGMSWLVPRSQQRFGDPADDLNVATIIFLIDGKLILLRPRRAGSDEVKYDMQVLADRIEFYWTHLSGIGTLENSLWGFDGRKIRLWLNALTIETNSGKGALQAVKESVSITPDFYPLCVLMDKGVVVGVEPETSVRKSLDFTVFRIITNTDLFLHHVLRFHLSRSQLQEAVLFATHYQKLVYFAHALEILLHSVLEAEADAALSQAPSKALYDVDGRLARPSTPTPRDATLPRVVAFLDHFDEALQVVVGCARKTEIKRWSYLFDAVGKPRDLFEKCIQARMLKVAASYLLVLHNLESLERSSADTIRLLKAAMAVGDWALCKELLRFLFSLDHTGGILRLSLIDADALPKNYRVPTLNGLDRPDANRSHSAPAAPTALLSGLGFGSAGDAPQDDVGDSSMMTRTASDPAVPRSVSPNTSVLGLGSLLSRVGLGSPWSTR